MGVRVEELEPRCYLILNFAFHIKFILKQYPKVSTSQRIFNNIKKIKNNFHINTTTKITKQINNKYTKFIKQYNFKCFSSIRIPCTNK